MLKTVMMITEQPSLGISIRDFNAAKQVGLFETLKQSRFSGKLLLTGPDEVSWTFHLYLGRLMYATGGSHPVKRWRRTLAAYCPQIPTDHSTLQREISIVNKENFTIGWEYELLCLWIERKKINREQVTQVVDAVITEVLFDITQAMQIAYELQPTNALPMRLVLIDAEQVILKTQHRWQAWQAAKVADRSPNRAPIIRQPAQLQKCTSDNVYTSLTKLLNGQRTLRDLAVLLKRDVVDVTRSLMPYVQSGLVELMTVPDWPPPISPPVNKSASVAYPNPSPLIACVDDSPMVCQTMEEILTAAGYQFLAVNDPLRAIAVLLSRKPDVLFLDLVMPNANGYEICSQLRKLPVFRETPILILTGNDGIVDRVRAKMSGSTDFLSKPVEAEPVLAAIRRHLKNRILV